MAALVRARHDVFGVVEVPATYLELDEWTEVDAGTPTAKEDRRAAELADPGVAAVLPFDPAGHNVEDVVAHLESADDAERARVIEVERTGKARKGVVEWQPIEA